MRCLLVHPWIADIAAFNFWLRPLGLYALAEWLWERGCDAALVDCLSPFPAPGKFLRRPAPRTSALADIPRTLARYGVEVETFRARVEAAKPFDAVLVTSALSYWYPGVQWAIEEVRRLAPEVPVALGGVYPTLWPGHARDCSGADQIFAGPLEAVSEGLADFLGLPLAPVRPPTPWYRLGLHDGASYAAVRTARGCPFRCTYCASGRLSAGFSPRGPEEVIDELKTLVKLGVRDVAFYDDALLVNFKERLLPILQETSTLRLPLRFHTPNGMHARLLTSEVASWLARAHFETVRLSLETVNPSRQEATGGKVQSEEMSRAVGALLAAGVAPEAIGVYLLLGLPGQSLGEVGEGIEFVRSLGVRPYLAEFSPIPGTPEWDSLQASGKIPLGLDPLLTNNSLFSRFLSGWDPGDLDALQRRSRAALG